MSLKSKLSYLKENRAKKCHRQDEKEAENRIISISTFLNENMKSKKKKNPIEYASTIMGNDASFAYNMQLFK